MSQNPPPPPGQPAPMGGTPATAASNAKTNVILAYLLWWVTGIIFLFVGKNDPDVKWNAAQSVVVLGGFWLIATVLSIVFFPVGAIVWFVGFVYWVIFLIGAFNYQGGRIAAELPRVIGWLASEFDAAEPPIQRALAAASHARDDRLRATIAASWANLVLATEDRVEEAIALADVAETWATEPTALVGCRTARARALVRLGDVQRADKLGREAVSLAEQTDSTDLRANALLHLAEVLRLSGRAKAPEFFEMDDSLVAENTGAPLGL